MRSSPGIGGGGAPIAAMRPSRMVIAAGVPSARRMSSRIVVGMRVPFAWMRVAVQGVAKAVEGEAAVLGRDAGRIVEIEDGVGAGTEADPLMF